jgi:hypothetical protein
VPAAVNTERSKPALNDLPEPRTIITRTVPGNALTVLVSHSQVCGVCGLCLSARLRVMVTTWRSSDSRTSNPASGGTAGMA